MIRVRNRAREHHAHLDESHAQPPAGVLRDEQLLGLRERFEHDRLGNALHQAKSSVLQPTEHLGDGVFRLVWILILIIEPRVFSGTADSLSHARIKSRKSVTSHPEDYTTKIRA